MTKTESTRQLKAAKNIYFACNSLIGGTENIMWDNPEDSKAYQDAKEFLANHEALVNELYKMATTEIYDDGYTCFDKKITTQYLRDINFCGKDWLMTQCDRRLRKEGY